MVPIHESDVAENRWKVAEWSSVEPWEKFELQLKQRRRWTLIAVILLFLALSAIPIVKDRAPKWRSLRMARMLAEKINALKLEASRTRKAVFLSVSADEKGIHLARGFPDACGGATPPSMESETFFEPSESKELVLLDPEGAGMLGLERITREFCFDPVIASPETRETALGLIPVNDLTERRTDRISFVFFRPSSSEVSFD